MRWAILKCVKVIVVGIFLGLVFSTSVQAWSINTPPRYELAAVKDYHSNPCPGHYAAIAISGEGSISACIMGENTRVASYFPAQGGVAYAISFPFENIFYRLDVCGGVWGCVYSDEGDTFVSLGGGYKNLTARLKRTIQNNVVHYTPDEQLSGFSVSELVGLTLFGQSAAVSNNGKWAAIEARGFGIFRINIQTLEMKRVIAPGFNYGYGYDPRVEMAISDDGRTLGVVGLRMSVWMVVINDTCGDIPNQYMQTYYSGAVTSCRYLETSPNTYIDAFVHALRPKFSKDNKNFSFDAYSNSQPPRHVTLFSESPSEISFKYMAIGDSFTSGEGEVDDSFYIGGAINQCHVSSRSYPYLLSHSWSLSGVSVACSGATIESARADGLKTNQPTQLAKLESYSPQVVTVGLGGNDAGLIGKLKDCLEVGTCSWAKTPKDRKSTATEIKNLFPRLKRFYQDVKDRASRTVIVVGYPFIISSGSECASPIGLFLNEEERLFMNESIHYLNQVIAAAANDAGVEYASTEDAFSGEELCTSLASPLMNDIRIGDDFPDIAALPFIKIIGAESFHPTPAGHTKMASKVFQAFPNIQALENCAACSGIQGVPDPGSYWESEETSVPTWRAVPFINKVIVRQGDSFEVSFPALSFEPSADIVLELHSEVTNLGTFQASNDGSFQAIISTELLDKGFHSVHAISKSFSGNAIDLYDFVAIEGEENAAVSTGSTTATLRQNTPLVFPNVAKATTTVSPAADVLGVTSLILPDNEVNENKNPLKQLSSKQLVHRTLVLESGLLGLAVGLGLAAVSIAGYLYYRRKQSSIS